MLLIGHNEQQAEWKTDLAKSCAVAGAEFSSAVLAYHCLSSGTREFMGYNLAPSPENEPEPRPPKSESGVVAFGAGENWKHAFLLSNTVYYWGTGFYIIGTLLLCPILLSCVRLYCFVSDYFVHKQLEDANETKVAPANDIKRNHPMA